MFIYNGYWGTYSRILSHNVELNITPVDFRSADAWKEVLKGVIRIHSTPFNPKKDFLITKIGRVMRERHFSLYKMLFEHFKHSSEWLFSFDFMKVIDLSKAKESAHTVADLLSDTSCKNCKRVKGIICNCPYTLEIYNRKHKTVLCPNATNREWRTFK